MTRYAIFSCEGFSREILPSVRKQISNADGGDSQIVFVEDDPEKVGTDVHGCTVISFEELQSDQHSDRLISVGVADPWVRKQIVDKCESAGFDFFSISDESHVRFDNIVVVFCTNTWSIITKTIDIRNIRSNR